MKRRVLFDLGHPGHFHLFKNAIFHFKNDARYEVFVTTRNIPMIIALLEASKIQFNIIGTKRRGIWGKIISVIETDILMLRFVVKHKIALGLHCGIVLSHVSMVTKMRSWIFDDDDDSVEPLMVNFSHPFSDFVFTPDCIKRKTRNAVYYPGTHELSYLFNGVPSYFSDNEKYSIVRLVAFNGHHDVGHSGLSNAHLRKLVERLERSGKVFITSEKPLPEEWEKYRVTVSAENMHSLMSGALLVVGDSQTMISEAATLGVPAFKCNSFAGELSVPNMLEREFGLCYSFTPDNFQSMYDCIDSVLVSQEGQQSRNEGINLLRRKKIDTSKMIIYCINKWNFNFLKLNSFGSEEWSALQTYAENP